MLNFLIKPLDDKAYQEAIKTEAYDIILYPIDYDEGHIKSILKQFMSDSVLNQTTYENDDYDILLLDTRDQNDLRLYDTYKRMVKLFDNAYKYIPLFKIYDTSIVSENIVNWTRTYEGFIYFGKAMKIEEARHESR